MSESTHHGERRGAPRRKTLKTGQLVFGDGLLSVDCVVKNLSTTGAGLKTDAWVKCPELVTLRINSGAIHRCQVMRYENNEMGVRFLGTA